MRTTYLIRPVFGIQFVKEKVIKGQEQEQRVETYTEDDVEIDNRIVRPDAFAAYFAEGGGSDKRERGIVYSEELGVCIQRLKEGFTLRDLWEINVD